MAKFVTTTQVTIHLGEHPVVLKAGSPVSPAEMGSFFSSLVESGAVREETEEAPKKKNEPTP